MVRCVDIRFSSKREVVIVDVSGGRVVFLDTSFVATEGHLTIRGRLAADGTTEPAVGVGLQDITITASPDAPITPKELRSIPWARILDAALDYGAVPIQGSTADGAFTLDLGGDATGADIRRRQSGRRHLDDAHYAEVADLYREALRLGRAPVQYVAERLNCAANTAKEYVAEARRRGALGPAPKPRSKGEQL